MLVKKNIVLVSTGIFQNYIKENINQLIKLKFDIHVIIDYPFFKKMDEYKSSIKLIDSATLNTDFNKKSKLDKTFRNGFWNNTSKRLFLIYEYMKMNNLENVIHLENDVLLYSNMNYNFDEKIYITMDSKNRCIPGIIYIPKYDLLTNLIQNYNFTKHDMINLANFYTNNKDIVKTFPIINDSIEKCIYNENFKEFNSIFDAAAIGQYLGGVDPLNIDGDTIGIVNGDCEIKFDRYTFKWIKIENDYFPYIEINGKLIPINNLHIHCKKLENFRMVNPVENKYIQIQNNNVVGKDKLDNLFNIFFNKQHNKTNHETLANYSNNILIAGGNKGYFYTHICYHTIYKALSELIKQCKKEYIIVETGCSAHGTKSTLLWDKFVNEFGGKVLSVDLNKHSVINTNKQTSNKTKVTHSDSLKYLPTITDKIDFLYLDSYDVDFLNPLPSAEHHLKEFNCVKHLLHEDSIILINDTPVSPEWLDNGKYSPIYGILKSKFDKNMTGKGSLVSKELEKMGAEKIMHQYQILWKYKIIENPFENKYILKTSEKKINYCKGYYGLKYHILQENITFITGEKIQFSCNHFIGNDFDFNFNHLVTQYNNRFIYIGERDKINNKVLIFCYTHLLDNINELIQTLEILQNPFKLVFHNSDKNFNDKHLILFEKLPLLQSIYTQNMNVVHEKVFPLPIGLANSQWKHGNTEIHKEVYDIPIEKTKEIYFNFNKNTNKEQRDRCYNDIIKKGIKWIDNLPYKEYLIELKQHKYAICVEGNGLDTHRFWECLYMNTIPICLKNVLTEYYKQFFPIILLNDWNELNVGNLVYSDINYQYLDMEYIKNHLSKNLNN